MQTADFVRRDGTALNGIMYERIGGYRVSDMRFVAAFDVDSRKVGLDLAKAVVTSPVAAVLHTDIEPTGSPSSPVRCSTASAATLSTSWNRTRRAGRRPLTTSSTASPRSARMYWSVSFRPARPKPYSPTPARRCGPGSPSSTRPRSRSSTSPRSRRRSPNAGAASATTSAATWAPRRCTRR
ncbi:hypothetical protein NKH77_53510 [Streptomyces sp. M19]